MAAFAAGCTTPQDVGELRTESRSVDLQGANSARVNLDMLDGSLNVAGADRPTQLMDADFEYNVAEWEPRIDYEASGGQGDLTVRQGQDSDFSFNLGDVRNEWDLRLNEGVPTRLNAYTGDGDTSLDLSNLDLRGVNVEVGDGDTMLDLSGDYERDVRAILDVGDGDTTVDLSGDHGRNVETIVDAFDGDTVVDLSGDYERGANAVVDTFDGDVTLRLPGQADQTGVRVRADAGDGDVNTGGLERAGNAYTNEAYR